MKYAFIDYENLNSLDGLGLQDYDRLFLFIGASNNQTEIRLSEKFDNELNITLITVKNIAKNNVDFHIAYYLGKLDEQCDKAIEFYILSNDQGYDGICDFIQHQKQGRICKRKGVQLEKQAVLQVHNAEKPSCNDVFHKYAQYMQQTASRHLPVKLKALRNNIRSHTGLSSININEAEKIVDKVIEKLISEEQIKVVDNKVSYPNR